MRWQVTKEKPALPNDAILCIDQGTTNSKAVLLDKLGQIVAQASTPLSISHPQPGWVEQTADAIWSSVVEAIGNCIKQAPDSNILAVGISNQRESVVQWDATTGNPIGPVITWQCRRTTKTTEKLKAEDHEAFVVARTGLPLDPLFPATKMRWLLDLEGAQKRCIGTVDSWLIWKLTGGKQYRTDRSNASRTQLLNIKSGEWDDDLCKLFGVDSNLLPRVTDSKHLFGHTRAVPGLADGIPIASAIGDSHAALFGHAAFHPGEAKATFGTGSSVMMIVPEFKIPTDGMTTTIAWSIDDRITHALEGNILVSASLFPWAAQMLGLDGNVDELMKLASTVDDSNGVALVPALVGLGAPYWKPDVRGTLTGLSFAATPAHIAHAAALSMPLQVVDVFEAMSRQSSTPPGRVFVDGGPTRNTFLMKYLADLLDQPVSICKDPELSALGAGMLAGLQIGLWSDQHEISNLARERITIEPSMTLDKRANIIDIWQKALAQCIHPDLKSP